MPPGFPFATDFLNREWPLLLDCCSLPRDARKISAIVGRVQDSDSFISLANAHGVFGHLAATLGSVANLQIPPSFLDSLREHQRAHLFSNLAMSAELFEILGRFHQSKIECVVVKGPILSVRAYGESTARQYADLDLLLRQKDIPQAAEILVDAGYDSRISAKAIREGKIPGEYRFDRQSSKSILELHTECTLRYFPLRLPIEKYFQSMTSVSLDGRAVPALAAEDEMILISVHGATHFWERLMWICDVAAMVHNRRELDWNRVRQSAAEVGAERMLRVALLLAEHVIRVPVPQEMTREVRRDSTCARLVRQIERWLPYAGLASPSTVPRALFRFAIRGNAIAGISYLTRLSFSPTEEDWTPESATPGSRLTEILSRPWRLARKYRRRP